MTEINQSPQIVNIPINDIHILNPRVRNQKVFREITENIAQVGLKRPITVTRTKAGSDKLYDLVCGQGRLEAFLACGQSTIPAIVISATEEEALTMGLVENLARRHHTSLELLKGIERLLNRGYSPKKISEKTGLTPEYVKPIVRLIELGEERLLSAVENGQLPLDIAVKISISPGEEQKALQDAYESNLLRGKKFLQARKLIEARRRQGKSLRGSGRSGTKGRSRELSGRDVMNIYKREVDRKRALMRKAEFVNHQIFFILEALKRLYNESGFMALLESDGMGSIPKPIAELLDKRGNPNGH
jgi:ParB family chromosome partitioning protein